MRNPAVAAHPRDADPQFVARVRMREAAAAEVAALVPLINDAYKARDAWLFGEQLRIEAADLEMELDDDRTTGIVAEIEGALAGFAVVRLRGDHAEFGLLATARQHQGQGLARLIMQRAEAIARDSGAAELRLECIRENGLPPFYAALGYREEGEVYGPRWNSLQPFTLVTMSKALAPAAARAADDALAAAARLRPATEADVAALTSMINEAYLREAWLLPPPRTTEHELRDEIARDAVRLIVAEVAGELAGSIAVWLRPPEGGGPHFGMLAVARRFQGRGLASLLVGEAEETARGAGSATLTLECAKELGLVPYYASLGYRVVREDVGLHLGAERPITKVTMRKELEDEGASRIRPDGKDGDHHGR